MPKHIPPTRRSQATPCNFVRAAFYAVALIVVSGCQRPSDSAFAADPSESQDKRQLDWNIEPVVVTKQHRETAKLQVQMDEELELKQQTVGLKNQDRGTLVEGFLFHAAFGQPAHLSRYAELLETCDIRDNSGYSPLVMAATRGRWDCVTKLLELGASPNYPSMLGGQEFYPLQAAAASSSFRSMKTLMDAGSRTDMRTPTDLSLLDIMREHGIETTDLALDEIVEQQVDSRNDMKAGVPHVLPDEEVWYRLTKAQADQRLEWAARKVAAIENSQEMGANVPSYAENLNLLKEQGEYQLILDLAPDAPEEFRKTPLFFYLTGNARYRLGRYDLALRDIENALALQDDYVPAIRKKATILTKLNKSDLAHNVIDRAIELDPNDAESLNIKGLVFKAEGDLENARKMFEASIARDPSLNFPYYNLARMDWIEEDRELAIENISKAISLDPLYHQAYNQIGYFYRLIDEKRIDSLAWLHASVIAASSKRSEAMARFNLAIVLNELGLPLKALDQIFFAIQERPDHRWSYSVRADIMRAIGTEADAAEDVIMYQGLTQISDLLAKHDLASMYSPIKADHPIFNELLLDASEAASQAIAESLELADSDTTFTFVQAYAPLTVASMNELHVLVLINAGIDLETIAPNGDTLLQFATRYSNRPLVLKSLIESDADLSVKDSDGKSLVDILSVRKEDGSLLGKLLSSGKGWQNPGSEEFTAAVDQAIISSIEDDFAQIVTVQEKYLKDRQERMDRERKMEEAIREIMGPSTAEEMGMSIEELDAMVAAGVASGSAGSRSTQADLARHYENVDRWNNSMEQLTGPNNIEQQLAAIHANGLRAIGSRILHKTEMVFGSESEEYKAMLERVKKSLSE